MINFNLTNNKKYVVGLSGGPDSMFLIDNLLQQIDPKNIIACHVNYNFRSDSNIDLDICKRYCQQNSVQLVVKNIDQDYKLFSKNFEAWARKIRYDFFEAVCNEKQFDVLLIAHNQNDDVETFLMQKSKRSLVTYFGIKKESYISNIQVIRPILQIKKSQILNYLQERKINFAIDSTNKDTKYTRNKIRASLEENKFEKILNEKNAANSKLTQVLKEVGSLIHGPTLLTKLLQADDEISQRLVFEKIKSLNLRTDFYSRKKQTIKEIVKQLKTQRSYLKIEIGDLVVLKDREIIHFLNRSQIKIIDKEVSNLTVEDKKYFTGFNLINLDKNLWVTNDWEAYKNELTFNEKPLSKVYKKYKMGYWERFFTPIVYNKSSKKILNYWYFNDKIKSMS